MQVCRMRKRAKKRVDCPITNEPRGSSDTDNCTFCILFRPGRQRQPPQSPAAGMVVVPFVVLSLSATFSESNFSFAHWQFLLFFWHNFRGRLLLAEPQIVWEASGCGRPARNCGCSVSLVILGPCRIARWGWFSRNHFRTRLASGRATKATG